MGQGGMISKWRESRCGSTGGCVWFWDEGVGGGGEESRGETAFDRDGGGHGRETREKAALISPDFKRS